MAKIIEVGDNVSWIVFMVVVLSFLALAGIFEDKDVEPVKTEKVVVVEVYESSWKYVDNKAKVKVLSTGLQKVTKIDEHFVAGDTIMIEL